MKRNRILIMNISRKRRITSDRIKSESEREQENIWKCNILSDTHLLLYIRLPNFNKN